MKTNYDFKCPICGLFTCAGVSCHHCKYCTDTELCIADRERNCECASVNIRNYVVSLTCKLHQLQMENSYLRYLYGKGIKHYGKA